MTDQPTSHMPTPDQPSHPAYPGQPSQQGQPGYPGQPSQPTYPDPSSYPAQPGYPPQPGYGAQPGYGVQPGYGAQPGYPTQPGYPPQPGDPAYPMYPAAPPPHQWAQSGPPLASWGDRVLATLIDGLYQLPAVVLYIVGIGMAAANAPTTRGGTVITKGNPGLMWVGIVLLALGAVGTMSIALYNRIVVQGRTGQSWGKKRVGIRVVHQQTGALIGAGKMFLRELSHYLDGAIYIGYLWPLWDPLRQTFADKIMTTVVVKER